MAAPASAVPYCRSAAHSLVGVRFRLEPSEVAQWLERWAHNPEIRGSNACPATGSPVDATSCAQVRLSRRKLARSSAQLHTPRDPCAQRRQNRPEGKGAPGTSTCARALQSPGSATRGTSLVALAAQGASLWAGVSVGGRGGLGDLRWHWVVGVAWVRAPRVSLEHTIGKAVGGPSNMPCG